MPVWRLYCPSLKEVPILAAVLLYYMGDVMISRTALPYITYGVCHDLHPNTTVDVCLHLNEYPEEASAVQKDSVLFHMAEKMITTIPPLLLAPLCGTWSDRHGRKPPFLLTYSGNLVAVIIFLLALYLHNVPVATLIIAGFLVRSFIGQRILFNQTSSSCLADVIRSSSHNEYAASRRRQGEECQKLLADKNRDEKETGTSREESYIQERLLASMCRQQVAETLGKVLGSFLGWLCQLGGGALLAFLVGAGICLLGMLVAACWVRDYKNLNLPTREATNETHSYNKYLKKLREAFSCEMYGVNHWVVWGCFCIMLGVVSCRTGRSTIVVPYIQQPPLSWPRATFSAFVACYSAFQSIFLFFIAPLLTNHMVVVVSLLFTTAGGVWMAFSTTTWSMFLAGCLTHMLDCTFPALRAILCSHLSHNQVGQILSKISLAEALANLVGPSGFACLYIYTKDHFAGLAFLVSSGLSAAVLLVGGVISVVYRNEINPSRPARKVPQLETHGTPQIPGNIQPIGIPNPAMTNADFVLRSGHRQTAQTPTAAESQQGVTTQKTAATTTTTVDI